MEEREDTTAAWGMLAVMGAFKLGFAAWIVIAYPSAGNLVLNLAHGWIWLFLMGGVLVALFAAPVLLRWRLRRVRAKRAQLLRAEWDVDGALPKLGGGDAAKP
jgi:hypothetical protein